MKFVVFAFVAIGAALLIPSAAMACPVTLSVLGAAAGSVLASAGGAAAGVGGSVALGASLAAELAVVGLGVSSAVITHTEQQKAAKRETKAAFAEAQERQNQAVGELGRENKAIAQEREADAIASAGARGVTGNLQNRGSVQLAALLRQRQRESQSSASGISARQESVLGATRSEFGAIRAGQTARIKAIRRPSNTALAINIASAGLGSLGGSRRTG